MSKRVYEIETPRYGPEVLCQACYDELVQEGAVFTLVDQYDFEPVEGEDCSACGEPLGEPAEDES